MITIDNILDVEKNIGDVKVVIFDLDDTLYNEIDYVKSGLFKISENYPDIPNMYEEMLLAFLQGNKPIDSVLEKNRMIEEKENCLSIYRSHRPRIFLDEKLKKMLLNIRKHKSLGLITDGRVIGQKNKILALGLDKIFDKIIITDELGDISFRKPNIKAYVIMKDYFKCDFSDMVYVGDNINKDFIAPEILGIKKIFYNNINGLYTKK